MFAVFIVLLITIGFSNVNAEESNVALKKPCWMSAQGHYRAKHFPCEKGNDGDTSEGSCFRSDKASLNYWTVDLQAAYNISRIRIFTRPSAAKHAKFVDVLIALDRKEENLVNVGSFNQLQDITDIEVPAGTVGDCVKIIQRGPDNIESKLQLCEIEVYSPDTQDEMMDMQGM